MKYKMMVSDYDDTLRLEGVGVSERNVQALKKYVAAGGVFALATGRTLLSIIDFAKSLGISDYMLPFNGAMIYDLKNEKIISKYCLEAKLATEIVKEMESLDLEIQIYSEDKIWVKEMTERSHFYERESSCSITPLGEKVSEFLGKSPFDPVKILCYCDPSKTEALVEMFNEKFCGKAQFVFAKPYLLECVSMEAGKYNSVSALAKMLGIENEDIFAVGDSSNDVEMIEKVGFGVAMGNAFPFVKKKAKAVTLTCAEDGVAYAVEKYILGEK